MSDTAVTQTTDTPTLQPHPETAVPVTPSGPVIDGEAPRLGGGPLATPSPIGTPEHATVADETPTAPAAEFAPTLPDSAPTLPTTAPPVVTPPPVPEPRTAEERFAQNTMQFDVGSLPTLPEAAPAAPVMIEDAETDTADDKQAASGETGEHPMAHLMPAKSKPTLASIAAAEQRAIKKAKAKKIKIGVFVGALAVSAVAGPPLVSWFGNALNEAGDTSTETDE